MPLVVVAIAFAVAAAATAIGAAIAQGEIDKANAIRQKVLEQYGDDVIPHLDKAIAQEVGPTALAAIKEDPETRGSQVDVMRKLQEVYQQGGQTKEDEAALQLANEGAQQQSSSDYQSLQQNLAARGQGNNPALAAAMAARASGDVVNATARSRRETMADARGRAFQALQASGNLAGNIRGQDYQQASALASAQDRINQFNAGQRTNADNENNRRKLQKFQTDMELRNARGNAYRDIAQGHTDSANNAKSTAAGIANAASSAGGAMAGGMGGGGGGGSAGGYSFDNTPGGPGGGAPAYGGAGSYGGGSSPNDWENPYL
jgi:hypothetical protein